MIKSTAKIVRHKSGVATIMGLAPSQAKLVKLCCRRWLQSRLTGVREAIRKADMISAKDSTGYAKKQLDYWLAYDKCVRHLISQLVPYKRKWKNEMSRRRSLRNAAFAASND